MSNNKQQYRPTESQASMFYDACKHLAAARNLFRDLATDIHIPHFLNKVCINAAADSNMALNRFKNIFSKERFQKFEQQVTESDPFCVEQIKEYVRRMSPEQQNVIENICQRVVAGEKLEIIDLPPVTDNPQPVTSVEEAVQ